MKKRIVAVVVLMLCVFVAQKCYGVANKAGWAICPTNKKLVAKIENAGFDGMQTSISEDGGADGSFYQVTFSNGKLPTLYPNENTRVQSFSLSWSPDGKYLLVILRRYSADPKGKNTDPKAEKSKVEYFSMYNPKTNKAYIMIGFDPKWVPGKKSFLAFRSFANEANGNKSVPQTLNMDDPKNQYSFYPGAENYDVFPAFSKYMASFYKALVTNDQKTLAALIKRLPEEADRNKITNFLASSVPWTATTHLVCDSLKVMKRGGDINCTYGGRPFDMGFGYEYSKEDPSNLTLLFGDIGFSGEIECGQ